MRHNSNTSHEQASPIIGAREVETLGARECRKPFPPPSPITTSGRAFGVCGLVNPIRVPLCRLTLGSHTLSLADAVDRRVGQTGRSDHACERNVGHARSRVRLPVSAPILLRTRTHARSASAPRMPCLHDRWRGRHTDACALVGQAWWANGSIEPSEQRTMRHTLSRVRLSGVSTLGPAQARRCCIRMQTLRRMRHTLM